MQNNTPVIQCEAIYKIFGSNAKNVLKASNGKLENNLLQKAGCIVGVNNASFELYEGELLVIMGLSGSGKSTLLRCISRLTETTSGKIFVNGTDIVKMNNRNLIELRRNKMGMVFQSFALLPHKTVLENIAFPLQIKGIKTSESINRAMEMVDLVGLKGRENNFPRQLSGGQQQRVGIARSLAVEPDIWFLDEPFSALDPISINDIKSEINRLKKKGISVIITDHQVREVLDISDYSYLLFSGEIIAHGTSEKILGSKEARKFYLGDTFKF